MDNYNQFFSDSENLNQDSNQDSNQQPHQDFFNNPSQDSFESFSPNSASLEPDFSASLQPDSSEMVSAQSLSAETENLNNDISEETTSEETTKELTDQVPEISEASGLEPKTEIETESEAEPTKIEPEQIATVASTSETINWPKDKFLLLQNLVGNLQQTIKQLNELLSPYALNVPEVNLNLPLPAVRQDLPQASSASVSDSQIVEGFFTGEKMIANDGQEYNVPVNYASKSKLVEGDSLKLIITERGTFVFKQIKPIERVRLVALLEQGPTGEYYVSANNRRWRVLNASITYFRGEIGDEVIVLIPKEGQSRWAAVENVIRKN